MAMIAQPGDVVLVRFPFTDLTTTKLPGTGLKTTSVIKAERIAVIERSVVVRKLGSLSSSQMEKLKKAVKIALNLA